MFTRVKEDIIKVIKIAKGEYIMKTAEINAIYSEDMEDFLDSLGVLEEINRGKKACYFCGKPLKLTDVQTVFPLDNDVQVCCNSLKCNDVFTREVK